MRSLSVMVDSAADPSSRAPRPRSSRTPAGVVARSSRPKPASATTASNATSRAPVRILAVSPTATLGALVASGGLGTFITDGLAVGDTASILTGALLVALLAVVADAGFGLLERATTPAGVRLERGRGALEDGSAAESTITDKERIS